MTRLRDLVVLLYRANWTQLSLSGNLTRRVDRAAITSPRAPSERNSGTGPTGTGPTGTGPTGTGPTGTGEPRWKETTSTVLVAPGGRFRVENQERDGQRDVTVCDGESCWRLLGDWAERREAGLGDPALAELLDPSWLLAMYVLDETGSVEADGRTACAATATPRAVGQRGNQPDRIDVLVDAELGILLRLEARRGGRLIEAVALGSVTMHPDRVLDLTQFSPPPGTTPTDPASAVAEFGQLKGPLGQVVGTAADLTSAALGFAVRHGPRPAAAAPAPPMPVSAPEAETAGSEPLTSDEINLLHRTGLPSQNFSAEVRHWTDGELMLEWAQQVRSSMRQPFTRQPFTGILGPDSVWTALGERVAGIAYRTARLRLALPGRYRIDYLSGNWQSKLAIACDGGRLQTRYSNRMVTGPAEPLEDDWARLADPAWLLESGWQLSPAGETTVGGRQGLLAWADARPGPDSSVLYPDSWYPHGAAVPFDQIAVIIDAELGILLRYLGYLKGRPAVCFELHDVQPCSAADAADFSIEIPPGTRVIESSSPLAHLDLQRPVNAVKAAGAIGMAGAAAVSSWLQNRPRTREAPDDEASGHEASGQDR